jgi:hypothetical protein
MRMYLSVINNLLEKSQFLYIFFNFSQVTSVELEEVLSQGAYMLLYCRYSCVYVYVCAPISTLFFFSFLLLFY